ncbi:MAG: ATP-dependent DNA helicase [Bacilli bacterium]|nr:ATP-dependent DNA helicase [Bacilli bacterium]
MSFYIWKKDREASMHDEAKKHMDIFFDKLKKGENDFSINGYKLTYRYNQHRFANDILKAIRDKELLLIQAGVGIGKSLGYLIPVFTTYNNVDTFENIVISTSTIGLQQQLLTDINNLSNMLDIDIKVAIAKGINNYACIEKIDRLLINADTEDKKVLKSIKEEINKKNTIDKDELSNIEQRIWKEIQISNRGICSRCSYSKECLHRKISKEINKANIVITNHDYLARAALDDRDFIDNADMFVIDEAHNLETSIRNINSNNINYSKIYLTLNYFINIIGDGKMQHFITETLNDIRVFFDQVKRRGSGYYGKYSQERGFEIEDCEKIPFTIDKMEGKVKKIALKLEKTNYYMQSYYASAGRRYDYRIKYIDDLIALFKDISKKDRSEKIYWVNFLDKTKINIGYTCRDTKSVSDKIFYRKLPIICTSATLLDANGSYEYLKQGLGIDKIGATDKTVVNGHIYHSPYNYDNNSIFYYDKDISHPNDIENYKQDLIIKISELLKITNGRALVLFTSKSMMDYIYENIDKSLFDFKLFKQGQESNNILCKKFESSVKSCLFATGAFWEGIDIKGKSLCNVIITRLPFANVDAVMTAKASEYKNDSFRMVYLNDMIQKLTQGTGRLIRDGKDKGIVACLDSRLENYIDIFKNVTDFTNYTSDIKDLYDYSATNITNRDGKRGPYHPRKNKTKIKQL